MEKVDINEFMLSGNFNDLVETIRKLHGKHAIAFCYRMVSHFSARNSAAQHLWGRILLKLLKDFERPWFH
jgi:hypothetical protein